MKPIAALAVVVALLPVGATGQVSSQFVDLFNGKDLTGWVNVNTDKDTWTRPRRPARSAPAIRSA